MTKGIKVWVVVWPNGHVSDCISFRSPEMCWSKLAKRTSLDEHDYKSHGYTVEPYTLTKGHSDE